MVIHGIRADRSRTYRELEAVARQVRAVLVPGAGPLDPIDPFKLFERLEDFLVKVDGREVPLSYECIPDQVGLEAETRYDAAAGVITVALTETAYANLEAGKTRARFTVAHEIGHAVLHSDELVRMGLAPHGRAAMQRAVRHPHPTYYDTEWQANAFAGALLMPAEGVVHYVDKQGPSTAAQVMFAPDEIAAAFGVSEVSARLRVMAVRQRRKDLIGER